MQNSFLGRLVDERMGIENCAYFVQKACWMDGRKEGRVGGWKDGKEGLRIAYSNQKFMTIFIVNRCFFTDTSSISRCIVRPAIYPIVLFPAQQPIDGLWDLPFLLGLIQSTPRDPP